MGSCDPASPTRRSFIAHEARYRVEREEGVTEDELRHGRQGRDAEPRVHPALLIRRPGVGLGVQGRRSKGVNEPADHDDYAADQADPDSR